MSRLDACTISFVLVVALTARARAQCDPYSQETKVQVPRALRLTTTCGNGRVDTYATSCARRVSGGCGYRTTTTTTCEKTTELCDGRALLGQSCATAGYAAGKLRCAATCDDFVYRDCAVCRPGSTCQERTVRATDFEDVTLFAQGVNIRAYWTGGGDLRMADVSPTGSLLRTNTIAKIESTRLVPVQVGDSAMILTGPQDRPTLSVVPAVGSVVTTSLPGRGGMLFLPIVPVEGRPLAVVLVGNPSDRPNVIVVDERGAVQPVSALYAQNVHRRLAIVPLAPGKHRVRWATFEDEMISKPGDALVVMFDQQPWLSLVRNGVAENPFSAEPRKAPGAAALSPDVTLDGTVIVSFGSTEDVALGTKHAVVQRNTSGLTRVFGDIAYDANHVVTARTKTLEVQAVRVRPPGDTTGYDFDRQPDQILAVAVRSLVP